MKKLSLTNLEAFFAEIAKKSAKKGDIVLFSPASASFDMFKNFADRGNQFKDLVNKI